MTLQVLCAGLHCQPQLPVSDLGLVMQEVGILSGGNGGQGEAADGAPGQQ